VHRENGASLPSAIVPASVSVSVPDGIPYRALATPDGSQVNLVPTGVPPAGRHEVTVKASYAAGGTIHAVTSRCAIDVRGVPDPGTVEGLRFRIEQMSIYVPSIVASFDQIGIASLAIDVTVARFDPATGNVAAWGVQKFGVGPDGEPAAGIPVPRTFFFAFGGTYRDGTLILESTDCQFEITAFPVPLDRLRFTATVTGAGVEARSMLAEVRVRSAVWRTVRAWLPLPRRGGGGRFAYRVRMLGKLFGAWFPEEKGASNAANVWNALRRMAPQAFWILAARVWRPWGMVDAQGWFAGLGTFLAAPVRAPSHGGVVVERFAYDPRRRRVRAWFSADPSYDRGDACPGILLVDRATGIPLPVNYSLALRTKRDGRNAPLKTTLDLPSGLDVSRGVDAVLFVDLDERAVAPLS
jgi:hypothetical protein